MTTNNPFFSSLPFSLDAVRYLFDAMKIPKHRETPNVNNKNPDNDSNLELIDKQTHFNVSLCVPAKYRVRLPDAYSQSPLHLLQAVHTRADTFVQEIRNKNRRIKGDIMNSDDFACQPKCFDQSHDVIQYHRPLVGKLRAQPLSLSISLPLFICISIYMYMYPELERLQMSTKVSRPISNDRRLSIKLANRWETEAAIFLPPSPSLLRLSKHQSLLSRFPRS